MTVFAVYRSLWRHKLLLVLLTASTAAAGWYLTSTRQPMYRASTLVRVQQTIADPADALGALQTAGRLAQTYVHIATTLTVANGIQKSLDGRVPLSEIAGNLEAHQVDDLDLLSLSATSPNPETALAIAARAPAALQRLVQRSAKTGDRISVVQPATLPAKPYSPRPLLALAIAAVLGLVLNGAVLLAYDLFSDRAVDGEPADEIAGRPVIALIPTLTLTTAAAIVRARSPKGARDDLELRRVARG